MRIAPKIVVLLLTLFLSSLFPASLYAGKIAHKRLSVAEAEQLVAAWVKNHEKSWVSHEPAKWDALHRYRHLHEITPKASWERLGVQVFAPESLRGISQGVYAVYIKNRSVYPLDPESGGLGVTSMCVCDQIQEGTPGLVYTYQFGSGIMRSAIAVLSPTSASSTRLKEFTPSGADLLVKRQKDKTIRVYAAPWGEEGKTPHRFLLGHLALAHKKKQSYLHVVLAPNLPKDWRDSIESIDR